MSRKFKRFKNPAWVDTRVDTVNWSYHIDFTGKCASKIALPCKGCIPKVIPTSGVIKYLHTEKSQFKLESL